LADNTPTAASCSARHMVRGTGAGARRSAAISCARHGIRHGRRPEGAARNCRQGGLPRSVRARPAGDFRRTIVVVLELGLLPTTLAALAGAHRGSAGAVGAEVIGRLAVPRPRLPRRALMHSLDA